MTERRDTMDLRNKRIEVSVMFDVVSIQIHCDCDYAAQVVFDDVAETIKAGGKIEFQSARQPTD